MVTQARRSLRWRLATVFVVTLLTFSFIRLKNSPAVSTKIEKDIQSKVDISGKDRRNLYAENILFSNSYVSFRSSNDPQVLEGKTYRQRFTKSILIYTPFFHESKWQIFDESPNSLLNLGCPISSCIVTYDRSKVSEAQAVVFHALNMPLVSDLWMLTQTVRKEWQRWVYFLMESPMNTPDQSPFNELFNLTITYKHNSDIVCPGKRFRTLAPNEIRPSSSWNYANSKPFMAAWLSSNCVLFRLRIVQRLIQHGLQVDVGGECSKFFARRIKCKRQTKDCTATLLRYKFYLAFENSFCEEYITEKYWIRALRHEMIPIVLGGANYTKLAISGSYIDARDFASAAQLVGYIHKVAADESLFNSYFTWKQTYKIGTPSSESVVCRLCALLHNTSFPNQVWHNLSNFWAVAKDCHKATVVKVLQ